MHCENKPLLQADPRFFQDITSSAVEVGLAFFLGQSSELSVKSGVVAVKLFRLIERRALALDPGVSLQFAVFFANADAQPRGDPLPAEQPPQCEGLRETRRMNHAVPVRGVDHVRGQSGLLVHRLTVLPRNRARKISFECPSRSLQTAQP